MKKKHLLLVALTAGLALPVQAEVSNKVHKMCLQAKDYLGCVKAQSGSSNSLEVITNPGTATARGNTCPAGYAYIGQGNCREVRCADRTAGFGGNDEIIRGKKWRCRSILFSSFSLTLGGNRKDIGNNPNCPSGEPEIGWTSTCEAPYEEPPKKDRILGRKE